MQDIIQLLPDNIANQIAAGEVIQRPASAVKELLENAVDAGADRIQLIVSDAGKSLIQVIDNGKGMSETDARLSFERHATSKIKVIDDLFKITTMGFRGEALASIAAVSQVEIKTKRKEDELGTYIEIENSLVKTQEPCASETGTSFSMKNIFFNVPARRNFLKSNASELKHIIEEFIRVSMAFPSLFFSFTSNGQEVFHLEPGSLKQRAIQIFGTQYNSRLVTVKEETGYMNISGYVGKPDAAKKTRGEQYFFVNNRFIKSAYLHHAVMSAFDEMIAKDSFPLYVLFIDLDPAQIDINVHPTKQEIKFEDERVIYAFVQSAIKHALAQFSVAPTLDFTLNADIQQLDVINKPAAKDIAASSSLFQTFTQKNQAHFIDRGPSGSLQNWKEFFTPPSGYSQQSLSQQERNATFQPTLVSNEKDKKIPDEAECFQLHESYIVVPSFLGYLLVNQQLAHERVLYEKLMKMEAKQSVSQQCLFPTTLELSTSDSFLLQDLLPDLKSLGYLVDEFGLNTFVIRGAPAGIVQGDEKTSIELLLEQLKHFSSEFKFSKKEKLVRCLARQQSIKSGQSLMQKEMKALIKDLFNCSTPNISPSGNPTYLEFKLDAIEKMFGK